MPTYTFKDTKTDREWTERMSIAEREDFLKDNPHVTQLIVNFPAMLDPYRLGITKLDNDYRNNLAEIKRSHPGSTLDTGNIVEV